MRRKGLRRSERVLKLDKICHLLSERVTNGLRSREYHESHNGHMLQERCYSWWWAYRTTSSGVRVHLEILPGTIKVSDLQNSYTYLISDPLCVEKARAKLIELGVGEL